MSDENAKLMQEIVESAMDVSEVHQDGQKLVALVCLYETAPGKYSFRLDAGPGVGGPTLESLREILKLVAQVAARVHARIQGTEPEGKPSE